MDKNYIQSSTLVPLPPEKLEEAREFVAEYQTKWKEDEGGESFNCRVQASVTSDGIWVRDNDKYIDIGAAVDFIDATVERFQLTEPVVGSWSCTCDKPTVNQFGGGAFLVSLGREPIVLDAVDAVQAQFKNSPPPRKSKPELRASVTGGLITFDFLYNNEKFTATRYSYAEEATSGLDVQAETEEGRRLLQDDEHHTAIYKYAEEFSTKGSS